MNTVVSFTARANPSADFDEDGDVDGADMLAWQRGLGANVGATHTEGDADRDGDIDDADLNQWKAAFGAMESISGDAASATIPEPSTVAIATIAAITFVGLRRAPPSAVRCTGEGK